MHPREVIPILRSTPPTLQAWLGDLPPHWTDRNEGGDTFSPFDVLGHLIHGEKADWMPRARIILDGSGQGRFETFDRFAQRRDSRGKTLEALLTEFARLRRENLELLASLDLAQDDLDRAGIHPELGEVTLSQLLATWVVHDLGHLAQIGRVMAKQLADRVGPWRAYLPVLQPRGPRPSPGG